MGASPIPLVAVLFALLVHGSISLLKVNQSTGKCVGYQIVTSSGISIIVSLYFPPVNEFNEVPLRAQLDER
ncbi:hypothetical protein PHLCEN_2v10891 [Hermanssonia centrifuga]|uniref:Uncharacterized protein n=1 Tax=Hermanssonia centrifuga TaxID=98765 RepID=A0A2R6NLF9_9APHY|nr:hypothetical protein PHLCEN_2v10891 [Hermanssonia centrifuga]